MSSMLSSSSAGRKWRSLVRIRWASVRLPAAVRVAAIFGIARHVADGVGDVAEVDAEDITAHRIEIDVMRPQRGGGHAQGDGQGAEGEAVAAEAGHQPLGDGENALMPLVLAAGAARGRGDFVRQGAEDAEGWVHGVTLRHGGSVRQYK